MKIFQVLLLAVLAFTCTNAMPKGQKRKEVKEELPEGFIQELQRLSKRRLPRLDTQRKLNLLFEKYDMDSSDRRKLLFWDLINLDNINLEDILANVDIAGLIGAITGALGGGDGGDGGNGNGGKFADEGREEAADAPARMAGKEAKEKKGGKRIRRQLYEDY